MSADNWTRCPNCMAQRTSKVEAVKKKYGKISADAYAEQLAKALNEDKTPDEPNLREDWELGIHDGKFFVEYLASCTACGWSKRFKIRCVVSHLTSTRRRFGDCL